MSQPRPLRSKDLDFLLLTGCSCLLALLHHPVAGQLTTRAISEPASEPLSRPIPTQSKSPSVGQYSALPAQRQRFTIREEESA